MRAQLPRHRLCVCQCVCARTHVCEMSCRFDPAGFKQDSFHFSSNFESLTMSKMCTFCKILTDVWLQQQLQASETRTFVHEGIRFPLDRIHFNISHTSIGISQDKFTFWNVPDKHRKKLQSKKKINLQNNQWMFALKMLAGGTDFTPCCF